MKRVILAIDSFKGCLTSGEANQAAAEGILAKMPDAEVVQVPFSDGGEGFLEAFRAAIGGQLVSVGDNQQLLSAGFSRVECIDPPGLPLVEAMRPETIKANIRQTLTGIQ